MSESKGVTATTAAIAKVMRGPHHVVTEDETKLILIFRAFVEEVPDAFQPAAKGTVRPGKRSRSDDDDGDEDDDDNDDDNVSSSEKWQVGSLFSKFEDWLRYKDNKFGSTDLNSAEWKSFLQLRLAVERSNFPNDKIARIKLKLPSTAFGNARLGNVQTPPIDVHQEGAHANPRVGVLGTNIIPQGVESHFGPSVFFGTRAPNALGTPSLFPGEREHEHVYSNERREERKSAGSTCVAETGFLFGQRPSPDAGSTWPDSILTTPQTNGSTMNTPANPGDFQDSVARHNVGALRGIGGILN
ncbi:hypothetical protein K435DRAFT_865937 [Dendrothele bispora CBS 962.96]|uniref:Uncharacterized protein n=1 Tax=Dendrothele bispora (strain CBS 962.96) TaxID=1314807 RepID=A0A4S8LJI0_DENBC|nr:hypothetical protein K435DRAFT_865937 [Dendrothele bispora CBS 962.96]